MIFKKFLYFIVSLIILSPTFFVGACARAQAPTEWSEYIELEWKSSYVKSNGQEISNDCIIYNNQAYIHFSSYDCYLDYGFFAYVDGKIIGKVYDYTWEEWVLVYTNSNVENPNALYTYWGGCYFREDLNIENWSIFDLSISAIGIDLSNSQQRSNGMYNFKEIIDFPESKRLGEIVDLNNYITDEQTSKGEIKLSTTHKDLYVKLEEYKDIVGGLYSICILNKTGDLYITNGYTSNYYKLREEYQTLLKNDIKLDF